MSSVIERQASPFAQQFRASSPYIREHRDKHFLLLIPESCQSGARLRSLVRDLALLHVLEVCITLLIELSDDREDFVEHAQEITQRIVNLLKHGLPSSPYRNQQIPFKIRDMAVKTSSISGTGGKWRPVPSKFYPQPLEALVNPIELIRPIVSHEENPPQLIPFDDAAESVAGHWLVSKLIVFNEPAVFDQGDEINSDLSVEAFETMLTQVNLDPISERRLRTLSRACRSGVPRGHVVSYEDEGALLTELFTADGSGTQVSIDEYLTIRLARKQDIDIVLDLMHDDIQDDMIIPRTRDLLTDSATTILLAEHDSVPVGCVALYSLVDGMQEIGTLIAAAKHRDQNIGSRLLAHAEKEAKRRQATISYVFSKHAVDWFQSHDYVPAKLTDLPESCTTNYDEERRSTLLMKKLT